MREVAVVAAGMTRFGELWGSSLRDLFVEAAAAQNDTIPARYNAWDHTDPHDVSDFDIYDGVDDPLRSIVSFEPMAPSREW